MALTTTADVMAALGVTGDATVTARYDMLRRGAERTVINWCKWPIAGKVNEIRYYDGMGYKDIVLMPFTSRIVNVWLDQQGNYGSTTDSFDAVTSLLVNGSDYALVFEGGGTGPLGQVGRSGLLRRLFSSAFWFPSDLVYYRGSGGLAYRKAAFWPAGYGNVKVESNWGFPSGVAISGASWSSGTATFTTATSHGLWAEMEVQVTGASPDGWNSKQHAVIAVPSLTTFTVAIDTDPGTWTSGGTVDAIPQDVKMAVYTLVGMMRSSVKTGYPLQSENLPDYSYSLMSGQHPELGTVRQILSAYRSTPAAGVAG